MSIFKDIVTFTFCVVVLFYGPGHFLMSRLKKEYEPWEKVILSFCVGVFLIPQLYYYLEGIKLHNTFLVLTALSSSAYCIWLLAKFNFTIKFSIERIFLAGIILIVALITLSIVGTSGLIYGDGMRFYQANAYDSVAQMAMVEELVKDPPHEFPFYSGLPLRGYHVGSFYWRAIVQKITAINSIDLFFRYCPLFLLALLILMVFTAIKAMARSSRTVILAVFLIFLMADLSWVFPVMDRLVPGHEIRTVYFMGNVLDWILFNPPLAHGVLLFFMGCYFLNYCDEKYGRDRNVWLWVIFAGILLGSLFEYKAFIWATVLPALVLVGIKDYFLDKRLLFLKLSFIAIGFSIISFFRISPQRTSTLFTFNIGHYPLSLLKEMKIVNSQITAAFFIIVPAFLFYLLGCLGIKITGFYMIYRYVKEWKKAKAVILLLIFSMALSFIFTHMFLFNSRYFYGTYNFFVVFLLGIAVFSGEAIMTWLDRLNISLKSVILLGICTVGIGSTLFSFLAYLPEYAKYKVISHEELAAICYLKRNSAQDAVILTRAVDKDWISQKTHTKLKDSGNDRDSFISAMTSRRTVLECAWHMEMGFYAPDLIERKRDNDLFFSTQDPAKAKSVLDKYAVSYVWVNKNKDLNFQKQDIVKKIFSNQAVIIYKVL